MNSMADTYILASKARSKLTKEAQRPDHDLRVLVSHANMLDNLMDKIQAHRESILNGSYISQKVSFAANQPQETNGSVSYEDVSDDDEDDDDYDSDSEDEDDGIYYKVSQVDFDDDEDEDEYESLSDISEDEDEVEHVSSIYTYDLERTSSKKFRKMPTIDELTELELEELSSESESEEEEEEQQEEQETDITELKRTPSLVYSTTEDDDSDSEDDEAELQHTHHHTPSGSDYTSSQKESTSVTHGNLLLENLESVTFTQPTPVVCQ